MVTDLVASNEQEAPTEHDNIIKNPITRPGTGAATHSQYEQFDLDYFPRDQNATITQDLSAHWLAGTQHVFMGVSIGAIAFNPDTSYLCYSTILLGAIHHLHLSQVSLNDEINQDALIRGVVEGWHVMNHKMPCCPIWDILRQIDSSIKIRGGIVTRLAMLRGIHLLLLVSCYFYCCSLFINLMIPVLPSP